MRYNKQKTRVPSICRMLNPPYCARAEMLAQSFEVSDEKHLPVYTAIMDRQKQVDLIELHGFGECKFKTDYPMPLASLVAILTHSALVQLDGELPLDERHFKSHTFQMSGFLPQLFGTLFSSTLPTPPRHGVLAVRSHIYTGVALGYLVYLLVQPPQGWEQWRELWNVLGHVFKPTPFVQKMAVCGIGALSRSSSAKSGIMSATLLQEAFTGRMTLIPDKFKAALGSRWAVSTMPVDRPHPMVDYVRNEYLFPMQERLDWLQLRSPMSPWALDGYSMHPLLKDWPRSYVLKMAKADDERREMWGDEAVPMLTDAERRFPPPEMPEEREFMLRQGGDTGESEMPLSGRENAITGHVAYEEPDLTELERIVWEADDGGADAPEAAVPSLPDYLQGIAAKGPGYLLEPLKEV